MRRVAAATTATKMAAEEMSRASTAATAAAAATAEAATTALTCAGSRWARFPFPPPHPRQSFLPRHMPSASLHLAAVGAGAAGLVVARELRREGHAPVVFERATAMGGTWLYAPPPTATDPLGAVATDSSLYASLRTNLPREAMDFLDFPFAADFPSSEDKRRFPGHEEVFRYQEAFARWFNLYRLVRFEAGGQWRRGFHGVVGAQWRRGWAVTMGQDKTAKILLEHGADPNRTVHYVFSPLVMACQLPSLKCIKILVEAGANVNFKSSFGPSALVVAVDGGLIDIVKYLLEVGADPNIRDHYGNIPIMRAASSGDRELVEILFPHTKQVPSLPDWTVGGIIETMKDKPLDA